MRNDDCLSEETPMMAAGERVSPQLEVSDALTSGHDCGVAAQRIEV